MVGISNAAFIVAACDISSPKVMRSVQLTLTHRYNVGLTPVLRFSGVMSWVEQCENAHYSFWGEKLST